MRDIPTLKLNTGESIPAIGFGTWEINDGQEVIGATNTALETGFRLIDTARIYGNEQGVGEAIRKSHVGRDEIFLTTKLWPSDFGYESAKTAFGSSLDRLELEYIDLYLMHWPSRDKERRLEAWKALEGLNKSGQARAIGVSNYMVEHLYEVLKTSDVVPAVNQIEFHPYIYEKQKPVLELCKKHGIVVEAYSPLSRGLGLDNMTVLHIAERTGKTPAQVVLRWAIQHGTVPLPKSVNPGHTKTNIEVFDFELSKDDMSMLDELSQ